jgi:release factor glutamine methyltransferase
MTVPTIDELLRVCEATLRKTSKTPLLDAQLLLSHEIGQDRNLFLSHGDDIVDEMAHARFLASVRRRAAGEPAAYILGKAGFYGREFFVTPDVLTPRPETEHLIEAVLEDVRARRADAPIRIADIGTGSGAIALTLACEMPTHDVYATDISASALAVAQKNAQCLGIAERVHLLEGDLAAPLAQFAPFTCIVANLPYIKSAQVPRRPDPVGYEPLIALDGGKDGLDLYRRLAIQAPALLASGASLFFEAAADTIPALLELVETSFPRAHVEIGEDYAGFERYITAVMP